MVPGPHFPESCSIRVVNCVVHNDWKGVDFTLGYFGGTVSTSPTRAPVTLNISQRDRNGKSCARIKGNIDVLYNKPTAIPFDASQLAANFPMATTSASGPPTDGLVAQINNPCHGTTTEMVVFPSRDPQCGCKVSFKRD